MDLQKFLEKAKKLQNREEARRLFWNCHLISTSRNHLGIEIEPGVEAKLEYRGAATILTVSHWESISETEEAPVVIYEIKLS